MKAFWVAPLICAALFLFGCSSVDVTTDYDREANFAQYRTFDWMERHNPRDGGPSGNIGLNDPLAHKHIKSAVERELLSKGIRYTETVPDFLVMVHATTQNRVDVERYGYRYGRWGRRYGTVTTVDRYKEGSIIIDFIDAKTKDMVWRGVAQDALRRGDSRADYIDECMKQLFKEYPPPQP